MYDVKKMEKNKKSFSLFFAIPMIWNGICLFISLVVGLTFLIGSQLTLSEGSELPGIIVFFFALFDMIMMISPISLAVMVVLSIFNLMRESTNARRWTPLVFSTIMQGLLSALFLSAITQPAG